MRLLKRATALTTTVVSVLFIAAAPAAATSSRRTSDACTHNFSGPQVCISISGHDNWADRVTVTWTDPGKVDHATALLHEGDDQREVHIRMEGHRQGGKIVAEWTQIQLAWGKVCGSFLSTDGTWACQDVYSGGAWSRSIGQS